MSAERLLSALKLLTGVALVEIRRVTLICVDAGAGDFLPVALIQSELYLAVPRRARQYASLYSVIGSSSSYSPSTAGKAVKRRHQATRKPSRQDTLLIVAWLRLNHCRTARDSG